jgi:hypothetical protein
VRFVFQTLGGEPYYLATPSGNRYLQRLNIDSGLPPTNDGQKFKKNRLTQE